MLLRTGNLLIEPVDLLQLALDIGRTAFTSEKESAFRKSISTAYYALFHQLTQAASKRFANAGDVVRHHTERVFDHGVMKGVCDDLIKPRSSKSSALLARMLSASRDPRLVELAATFVKLQEARHRSDYDLHTAVTSEDMAEALRLLVRAWTNLDDIETDPDTQVFLTAILMADRWKRVG